MSLSAPEIGRVLAEIGPASAGAYVNRIRFQHGTDLLLDLRNGALRATLLVSVHSQASRIGFVMRPGGTGEDPGGFLQLLRARMEGLRVNEPVQVGGDRIVRLHCAGKPGGPRSAVTLVAELMGARSNLYLLDDEGRVEGALRPGGFRPGTMWSAPGTSGEAPDAAREFADTPGESYCERIETFYADEIPRLAGQHARSNATGLLRRELARLKRLQKNLRGDIARAGDPEELRIMGQLLKANARLVPAEATEVSLPRWDRPDEKVRIALKSSESAGANADRYFDQAKRAERTIASAETRMGEAAKRIGEIEDVLAVADELAVDELETEARRLGISASAQRKSKTKTVGDGAGASAAMERLFKKLGIKPRAFLSDAGQLILVGRSSTENDAITTKVARPHDFFFHVVGGPGSHVIACVDKGAQLDPATRRRAAELALRYSGLAKSGRGEVSYCERRYVRKRKGDPPGLVHLTGRSETVWVELPG